MTHHLMVMHPHTKYHWPISKDKNVMARTRKYYLKNNYLTLRSRVKVPRRWPAMHVSAHFGSILTIFRLDFGSLPKVYKNKNILYWWFSFKSKKWKSNKFILFLMSIWYHLRIQLMNLLLKCLYQPTKVTGDTRLGTFRLYFDDISIGFWKSSEMYETERQSPSSIM
jgi:hypothetical protein